VKGMGKGFGDQNFEELSSVFVYSMEYSKTDRQNIL
jgi:hypothetical protein